MMSKGRNAYIEDLNFFFVPLIHHPSVIHDAVCRSLRELCVLNNNQKVLNRLYFSWLRCPLEDPFLREYATREPRRVRRGDLTPQKDDKPSAVTDSASFYIIFRPHSDLRTRASAVPARPITRLASKPSKPVRSCTIFCCPPSVSTTFHMYSPRCVYSPLYVVLVYVFLSERILFRVFLFCKSKRSQSG